MIQRLHFCILCSFVILVISSFISGRAGEVESLDLSRYRPEGMWCDASLRIMARKIFSPFWQLVGSRLLLSLTSISLLYRSQFVFFRLMLERCCIGLIVTSICTLMRIGRWSESSFRLCLPVGRSDKRD